MSRHLTRFVPPRRVPAGVLGGLGAGVAVLLAGVPPPLWDDLVEHLRTRDDINDWTYADAAVLNTLRSLSEDAPAPADPNDIAPMARASEKAEYWKSGLLAGKTSYPDDWRPIVKARACGVGADGTLAPGAAVLVWLDPDAIRDRWTPEMIQRTVRVRVQRTEGWNRLVDRIPDIVTAPTTAQLRRYDGSTRDITDNAAVLSCFAAGANRVPEGALALRVTLRRNIDTGWRSEDCTDPDQIGRRRFMWARHNGVYIVPRTAILDDGSPHPDRGEALLDPPVTDEAAAVLVRRTCRPARTMDAVVAPDCRAAHGGRFDEGTRKSTLKTITYPEGWPVDQIRFRRLEDDCFRQVEQTGAETREIACPAGHSGRHIKRRSFRWYNRDWAVPSHHNNGIEGNRTFAQALAAWKADPAQAGKKWYDTVVLVRDWHLARLTCKAPRKISEQQLRSGTCLAWEVGFTTEARTLNWYNRDPGATPPHVITDREVEEAAAAYDATPSQAGLAWYRKVTATPWAAVRRFCSVSPSPSNPSARTCDNTCAERGGIAGRNSGGEYCQSPKLPLCRRGGGNEGDRTGDDTEGSYDTDGDGVTDSKTPNSPNDGFSNSDIGSRTGGGNNSGDEGGKNE